MKSQKLVFFLCCSFVFTLLSGCTSSSNATELAGNDRTPIPSVIPMTVTDTAIAPPTLQSDEAYALLKRLTSGRADCQLPCWGGIEPGLSSNMQAEKTVQLLFPVIYGGPPYAYKGIQFSGPSGGRDFFFGNTNISFVFGWLNKQGKDTVERIHIKADVFEKRDDGSLKPIYGSPQYNELFEEYSLHGILSSYGMPSRSMAFAYIYNYNNQPIPNPEEFQLLLLYDRGIFIEYSMPLKRTGDNKGMACPSEALFDIWLMPSESSQFFQEMTRLVLCKILTILSTST